MIQITRRRLLQAAPAALFVPKMPYVIGQPKFDVALMSRGGSARTDLPAQPAAAAAAGFNTLTFWDDFNNPDTVDSGFTQANGFNMYQALGLFTYNNGGPNEIGAPVSMVVNNSILTIEGTATHNVVQCGPITGSSNPQGYIGPTFGGGWYAECKISFDPANFTPFAGAFDYPAFWSEAVSASIGRPPNIVEFDLYEAAETGPGTYNSFWALHDWIQTQDPGSSENQVAGQDNSLPNNDYPNYHQYGVLWIPQAKNGGSNGVVRRYFDRTERASLALTYSNSGGSTPSATPANPSGVFSIMDSEQFAVYIEAGYQKPVNIDYLMIWQ